MQLLSAAVGFGAGLAAEHVRVGIWVRQEKWKVRRELYSGIIASVLELREAFSELDHPFVLDAGRLGKVREKFDKANGALARALADAAIVDERVYQAVMAAQKEMEEKLPREMAIAWAERQKAIDSEQDRIDVRHEFLKGRIDALMQKLHRAVDFGETMTEHESAALGKLLEEQGQVMEDWGKLRNERDAFAAEGAADAHARHTTFARIGEQLIAKVGAFAREGGLDP